MSALRRIGAGLVLALIAVLAIAVPASAHDQLTSSTPAEGEALATAPGEVVMTFSGELIVLDASTAGAVVMVVDASGQDWATGEVDVRGNTVTTQLKTGMPVAGYQVRWQVVSEDGHPISGVIPFTIGDAAPMVTAGNSGSAADSDAVTTAEDQIPDLSGSPVRVLLIGAGGAAIAATGFALYRFLRRPKATAAPPESGDEAAEKL